MNTNLYWSTEEFERYTLLKIKYSRPRKNNTTKENTIAFLLMLFYNVFAFYSFPLYTPINHHIPPPIHNATIRNNYLKPLFLLWLKFAQRERVCKEIKLSFRTRCANQRTTININNTTVRSII